MTDFNKKTKKVTFHSFVKGQFNYCPLLCMFSTRSVNHKINRLREKGLKVLLNDETSTFKDTLSKSNDTTIHVNNIQKLIIEFYKYLYSHPVPIMKEAFAKRVFRYNPRRCRESPSPNHKAEIHGTDAIVYKAT